MQEHIKEQTTETIPFDAGVDEAKKILASIEKVTDDGHLRIGEIADKLETKYADRTIANFAKEIGKSPSCVKRWLSVYRAWKETQIGAARPQLIPYAVLRELQDVPDREQIIRDNPNITTRQAIEIKRKRENKNNAKDNDAWLKTFLKGFKAACNRTAEAARWAEGAFKLSSAELDKASQKTQALLLTNMRKDAKLVIEWCDLMAPFVLDEEAEQEAQETTEHAQTETTIQAGVE
jgi:hypothetical protein